VAQGRGTEFKPKYRKKKKKRDWVHWNYIKLSTSALCKTLVRRMTSYQKTMNICKIRIWQSTCFPNVRRRVRMPNKTNPPAKRISRFEQISSKKDLREANKHSVRYFRSSCQCDWCNKIPGETPLTSSTLAKIN
jgi:hypothetical protein